MHFTLPRHQVKFSFIDEDLQRFLQRQAFYHTEKLLLYLCVLAGYTGVVGAAALRMSRLLDIKFLKTGLSLERVPWVPGTHEILRFYIKGPMKAVLCEPCIT